MLFWNVNTSRGRWRRLVLRRVAFLFEEREDLVRMEPCPHHPHALSPDHHPPAHGEWYRGLRKGQTNADEEEPQACQHEGNTRDF